MARVMVLWLRPHVLPEEEAVSWARREMDLLVQTEGIEAASLQRVQPVSEDEPRSFDWLLELELGSAKVGSQRQLADLVRDLRLLGMRPVILAVADPTARLPR